MTDVVPFDANAPSVLGQVLNAGDANPDNAARALQLSQVVGVPASIVADDVPTYDSQAKANLGASIVQSNDALQRYVRSHPLAAAISNDDWPQMDASTKATEALGQKGFWENTADVFKGAVDGLVHGPSEYQKVHDDSLEWLKSVGVSEPEAQRLVGGLSRRAYREEWLQNLLFGPTTAAISPLVGAFRTYVSQPLERATGFPAEASEAAAMALLSGAHIKSEFLRAGRPPPVGVDPQVDQLHGEQAAADKQTLNDAIKAVQGTNTVERSPELMAEHLRQIVDGDVGINAKAVLDLYGDKAPTPDDGLLGWAPNIRAQLETASATGGDVQVPLADYLVKATPEIRTALQDHIRMRPDGMTVEEAKGTGEPVEVQGPKVEGEPEFKGALDRTDNAVQALRESSGLDPSFDVPRGWANAAPEPSEPPEGTSVRLNQNVTAYVKPAEEYTANEKAITDRVNAIIDRIVPKDLRGTIAATELKRAGAINPRGVYIPAHDQLPIIAYAISDAAPGTMRHEAIHHLRRYGFITNQEWSTLEQASKTENWIDKHSIGSRYQGTGIKLMLEESIAEEFRAWGEGKDVASPVRTVFEKIKALFEQIKASLREFFGREPTIQDIFERIESGEVGSRKGTGPIEDNYFDPALGRSQSRALKEPVSAQMEAEKPFEKSSPGLTRRQTDLYYRRMSERQEEDQLAASARIKAEQERRQTAEWKDNRKKAREETANDVYATAAVRLFEHLSQGRLAFKSDALSSEQREALPRGWAKPNGLDPADIAAMFEAHDPQDLIHQVSVMERARGKTRPQAFVEGMVDRLTDQRMEARFGKLSENILEAARDQVLSETQEDMLHEQTLRLAEEAGAQFPIKKDDIKAGVKAYFKQLPARVISSARFLADAGRAGRAMEEAHLTGDVSEAFRQSQAQQTAFMFAREARAFEKERGQFQTLAKRYSKREVDGTAPQFTNAIHTIFAKVGLPIGRLPADLARETANTDFGSLGEFLARVEKDYEVAGLKMPVADFLVGDNAPQLKDMTVDQYRGLAQSVKTLNTVGRNELRVLRQGAMIDRSEWLNTAAKQMAERFDPREFSYTESPFLKRLGKQFVASLHSVETVFHRFDGRDFDGLFTNQFVYPGADAANHEAHLQRETGRSYRELGAIKNPKQAVTNDFIDPMTGSQAKGITRANLEAIVANIGNKYNLDRIAYTLGVGHIDADGHWVSNASRLMQWIEKNTTREDIDRAEARGKIFSDLKKLSDTIYRNIYGVAPEDIELQPFSMHGKQYDGWYHPIIQDEERALRDHAAVPDTITSPTSFWPSTPNSYTIRRTGAFERLSLSDKMVPIKLNQMIHDIAAREFVWNASKLINDNRFRQMIAKHYGKEYHDIIKSWLWRIAGSASYDHSAMTMGAQFSNWLRQNVISTYIGFGASTVMKHGPTALIMSAKEVGLLPHLQATERVLPAMFRDSVQSLFGKDPVLGNSIWQFIWNNSEEIQRRDRNWAESLGGAHDIIHGKSTLRNKVIQWGSKPVALSDMASAAPLWLAKYEQVLGETGLHGKAVDQANFAVRRAHGSTAVSSLPEIAAQGGALAPWFTSLYGFFGANMQRRFEILHDMNDSYKLGKQGELKAASKLALGVPAAVMAYVILPSIVEEWVVGQGTEDHRSWLARSTSFVLHALTNSIVGARDLAWGLTHGTEPSAGLMSGPLEDLKNLAQDVQKPRPMSKDKAGRLVQDGLTAVGDMTGLAPKPIARALRYGMDVLSGVQRPRTAGDWWRGVTTGQQKKRVIK